MECGPMNEHYSVANTLVNKFLSTRQSHNQLLALHSSRDPVNAAGRTRAVLGTSLNFHA